MIVFSGGSLCLLTLVWQFWLKEKLLLEPLLLLPTLNNTTASMFKNKGYLVSVNVSQLKKYFIPVCFFRGDINNALMKPAKEEPTVDYFDVQDWRDF